MTEEPAEAEYVDTLLRRKCDQHECSGEGCVHRNHRRDAHYLAVMRKMLGLGAKAPESV